MRKRYKEKIVYRAAFAAAAAMLLSVFAVISVSGKNNELVSSTASINHSDKLMSDWVAIPLSKMVGTAELIVRGSVISVGDSTYVFSVDKQLSDTAKYETIEVMKVKPDKFASTKPAPYEKGQRFILFLIQEKKNPRWKVMGTGGEGQMPVVDNYVYFSGNNIDGLEFNNYNIHGKEQYVQRFDASLFMNAVEEYGKCFHWTKDEIHKNYIPQKICDDSTVSGFKKKSFIHNYLIIQTNLFMENK